MREFDLVVDTIATAKVKENVARDRAEEWHWGVHVVERHAGQHSALHLGERLAGCDQDPARRAALAMRACGGDAPYACAAAEEVLNV